MHFIDLFYHNYILCMITIPSLMGCTSSKILRMYAMSEYTFRDPPPIFLHQYTSATLGGAPALHSSPMQ